MQDAFVGGQDAHPTRETSLRAVRMEFETEFTYEFVKRSLPDGTRHILEVGCGSGALALALSENGFAVIALDADADSVAAAQKLGVDARVAAWPDFNQGLFDAVVFSRSLHHIHPLGKAVKRVADCLRPGGRLVVEDFSYEAADKKTLSWFVETVEALTTAGSLGKDNDHFNATLTAARSVTAWRKNRPPHLHTAEDIRRQIGRTFGSVTHEHPPYLFRYIKPAISSDANRYRILKEIAEKERSLIAAGAIIPLGRRLVAGAATGK